MMCDALGFRGWGREAAQVGESSGWLVKPGLVSFFIIANLEILEVPARSSRSGIESGQKVGNFLWAVIISLQS
jgi:hypothetical protein